MLLTHASRLSLLGLLLLPFASPAQQFPSEKMVDWSNPGRTAAMPAFDTLDVLSYGLAADGETPNDQALKDMVASFPNVPTVFYFPPGEYFFTDPIQLNSQQVLCGAGASKTTFRFDLGGNGHLISASGQVTSDTVFLAQAVQKDDTLLQVSNVGNLQAGDYVQLMADDSQLVTSSWAAYTTGQLCQIAATEGNSVQLVQAIRRDFELTDELFLVRLEPVEWVGVEHLSIVRVDATASQTSHIFFNLATNCWVDCVRSELCNFGHVTLQRSSQITVSGSHFQNAFAYGGGGQGYGVVLQSGTGDCLVENNTFDHLRHAMLLQAGANGNVLSYNHSTNPFWTEVSLPANSAGDLVLHGNYPYANLLEGNIVQNIVVDDSHGDNGPGNTFFRNRTELYGIYFGNAVGSPSQLAIGNELISTSPFTGLYYLIGEHFEYGNNVQGTVQPANTNQLDPTSLYLSHTPGFLQAMELETGSIGLPHSLGEGSIPSEYRATEDWPTACEFEYEPPLVSATAEQDPTLRLRAYPNPTNGPLFLAWPDAMNHDHVEIRVVSSTGQQVFQQFGRADRLDLSHLAAGIYFLQTTVEGNFYCSKIILNGSF